MAEDTLTFDLPITAEKVAEFAQAVGEDNEILFVGDAARLQGLPDISAPPTFTQTQTFHIPSEEREKRLGANLDYGRVLHGEQEYVYKRLPIVGETLKGEMRIVKDISKEGKRGGTMRFITYESKFTDADGDEVLSAYYTVIETGKDPNA